MDSLQSVSSIPAFYALGKRANYANYFHDITTGQHVWSSSPTKFHAVSGYDLCTGLGTPNGTNLINALAGADALIITPVVGFSADGPVGGPFSTTSGTFSLTNAVGGTLTWSLSTTSAWLAVSATNGTLMRGGSATTVNVNLAAPAGSLPVGTYEGTIWFTNQTSGVTQGRSVTLSIGQSCAEWRI